MNSYSQFNEEKSSANPDVNIYTRLAGFENYVQFDVNRSRFKLDLSSNHNLVITHLNIHLLVDFLWQHPEIEELVVPHNRIDGGCTKKLAPITSLKIINIENPAISNNPFSSQINADNYKELVKNPNLHTLTAGPVIESYFKDDEGISINLYDKTHVEAKLLLRKTALEMIEKNIINFLVCYRSSHSMIFELLGWNRDVVTIILHDLIICHAQNYYTKHVQELCRELKIATLDYDDTKKEKDKYSPAQEKKIQKQQAQQKQVQQRQAQQKQENLNPITLNICSTLFQRKESIQTLFHQPGQFSVFSVLRKS